MGWACAGAAGEVVFDLLAGPARAFVQGLHAEGACVVGNRLKIDNLIYFKAAGLSGYSGASSLYSICGSIAVRHGNKDFVRVAAKHQFCARFNGDVWAV